MKCISLVVVALALTFTTQAQVQKKDTSVLLKLPADPSTVARFKAKLVELAMTHPDMQQYAVRKQINKYETNIAGSQWLNHFTAAGNLNEFTIKGNNNGNANFQTFYPRYNFGVLLPIGNLIKIPNDVKRTRAEKKLLETQEQGEALSAKALVLQQYEEYAAAKQLFELHLPVLEDALQQHTQAEEKFRAGDDTMPLQMYKESYRLYNAEMAKKVMLEKDLRQAKLKLEGMVGTTLEQVMLML
ncbi:TolC family protein [Chitinophaga sp.]|uniref:TolC family protein n=1 Tax=Chitinophaga sp. TaxID=1869181 RepID=UPI00263908CF|nr:TolC family protein [uncultured Chitinophaga sp.]